MFELNVFGEEAEFDHLGLALQSINDVTDGVKSVKEDTQKVSVAFIQIGGIKIELIEPLNENSPILTNLKNGQKLVHMCFRVPNIDASIQKARKFGFHCIRKAVSAVAFNNKNIAWLYSRTYGLVELLEK